MLSCLFISKHSIYTHINFCSLYELYSRESNPKYNCHKCNEKQLRNPLGLYYEQLIYALFRDNFCHTSVTLQSHFLTKIVDYHKQTYIHTNDKNVWNSGFKANV